MCGITGWFSRGPHATDAAASLAAMARRLVHRGPDDLNTLLEAHAALGHTRLSIIDNDGGRQPFTSADGRYVLIYNGEIYNHAALRARLEASGVRFSTRSDTEVLLAVLTHPRLMSLGELRGMYAFALWDRRDRRALLGRDPLGIKPLFYTVSKSGDLVFGSEAKAILARPLVGGTALAEEQLHLLLNFRYLPGDGTLFKGVQQLPPGALLHWDLEQSARREWIPLPECRPSSRSSLSDGETLQALQASVSAHLVADVPVGVYLSGGIDSACVTALAGRRLDAYTLAVGDDPDEALNASESARLLGVAHTVESPAFKPENDLHALVWHLELPKVNALQGALLARVAAPHVKVALSGLGGDELFLGYNAHRLFSLFMRVPRLAAPFASAAAGLWSVLSPSPWTESERALRMVASGDAPTVYGLLRNVWDAPSRRRELYGERMLDQQLPDAFDVLRELWPAQASPVESMRDFEWRHKMVNDLLWTEDRVSMASGLEVRVPLVDGALWAHTRALPAQLLMADGQPKAAMRRALASTLPESILQRRKSGFQLDSPAFFDQFLTELADEWLAPATVARYGLFNATFVQRLLALTRTKRHRWHYFLLLKMLLSHLWIGIFEDDAWRPV